MKFLAERWNWNCYASCDIWNRYLTGSQHKYSSINTFRPVMERLCGQLYQDWGWWVEHGFVILAFPSAEIQTMFLLETTGFRACTAEWLQSVIT